MGLFLSIARLLDEDFVPRKVKLMRCVFALQELLQTMMSVFVKTFKFFTTDEIIEQTTTPADGLIEVRRLRRVYLN